MSSSKAVSAADNIVPFPVVGIGASAGGLEAFKKLVGQLSPTDNTSYILVQHLDADHKSLLVDILSRHTSIPVAEITDGMPLESGRIYIVPPGKTPTIHENNSFKLQECDSEGINQQVDLLFRTLAETCQERAIAVILTGRLNDGSCGIRQIKENGGMVIAQNPESAEFPEMPGNAINTGLVDLILDLEKIPGAICNYVSHSYISGNLALKNLDELEQILTIIKAAANYDFCFYKKNTLIRRTLRRMGLKNLDSMKSYVELLKENPLEVQHLFNDLLIGVTEFFRDPEVWKRLKDDIFRKIIKALPVNAPVRVWIPGCSSGEEAYSVAMVLAELFEEYGRPYLAQIFATDIDETSIAHARAGLYSSAIAETVSPERLKNHFTLEESGYRISRPIRESVIFAVQNLICDAPFSDLDFVSCRNLLIYLDPDVQKSIIDLFSFSLREGGYLLLGCSETVGFKHELFEPVCKKLRIYRMSGNKRSDRRRESIFNSGIFAGRKIGREQRQAPVQLSLEAVMHRQLLHKYAPAAVIVNQRNQIIYFFGPTENYLNLPKSEPNFDLLTMAREEIRTRLRSALHKATKERVHIAVRGIETERNGIRHSTTLEIFPIRESHLPEGLMLLTFNDEPTSGFNCPTCPQSDDEPLVKHLEQELSETREDLQNTIEELETSNEELKASNEEMMSMNEELQSTNEELETSKEELQSLNEELNSVNAQLREKVRELEVANNDIINFMNSSEVATVFLDRNAVIRRFTPAAKSLFNLIPSDIGRPIDDLNNLLKDQQLQQPIARVLKSLNADDCEIESSDGRCFIRRIVPFRTEDDRIDGVVITFVDITDIKQSKNALQQSENRFRQTNQLLSAVLQHTHMMTAYLDPEFNFIWVNRAFSDNARQSDDLLVGKNYFQRFPNAENKAIFLQVVKSGDPYFIQGKPFVFADQLERGLTYWDWSLIPVKEDGRVTSLVLTLVEATSRIKAEIAFKEETRRKNQVLESIRDGFFSLNNKLSITYFNSSARKLLKISSLEPLPGKRLNEIMPTETAAIIENFLKPLLGTSEMIHQEICLGEEPDQEWLDIRAYPFTDGVSVYFSVVTDQILAQRTIREQADALKQAQSIAQVGSWQWDIRKARVFWSDEMYRIFGVGKDHPIDTDSLLRLLVHPEDREKFAELMKQISETQNFKPCEYRIIRPDGSIRTLWAEAGATIVSSDGHISKIAGIIHDVTDRKKLENERLQLEKIANRSQKTEALGALAAGIAHNFNNFLCGIFGNIELAMSEADTVRREQFLQSALSSMEPAKALTRQLITFARGGEPERSTGEIWPTIEQAARFALSGSNIDLTLVVSDRLHSCSFDPGQIGQVINSLALNSRQAMTDGGKITVSAKNTVVDEKNKLSLKPGPYVKISFCDNGPGIPEKFAPHIFDPFFSTKFGNQGLGLAISFSIINKHDGVIEYNQAFKEGCSFNIYLPGLNAEPAPALTQPRRQMKGSGKILVMDDEPMVREVLTRMLEIMGFEVIAVVDGKSAIEELVNHRNRFRAAILDLTVPGAMGGREACEIMRSSGMTLPIFAASGYAADPVITNPENFGFDGSIAKPFTMAILNEKLESCLAS